MRTYLAAKLFFILFSVSFTANASTPKVATDIAPIHSLVSSVMEGVGEPSLIIPANASPHEYALKPSQARALSQADVVFWLGEDFTPWLAKALNNISDKATKVTLLETSGITTHAYREGATFEQHAHHDEDKHGHHDDHHGEDKHGHHDDHHGEDKLGHHDGHHDEDKHGHHDDHHDEDKHGHHDDHHDEEKHGHHDDHHDEDKHGHHDDHHDEEKHGHHDDHRDEEKHGHHDHHGHDHDGVDPHAWLDPQNAKVWVQHIAETLAKKDSANSKTYLANATKTLVRLDDLIKSTNNTLRAVKKPKFIVFHDAYQYFEKKFEVPATGAISLGDAEDPSPARIKEIQTTAKKLKVNCVFTEPQYNPGIVKNVFAGSVVSTIGVIDPLGSQFKAGNDHYFETIKAISQSLLSCK